ncbi:uncharacterized protein VDAG_02098 [Verticillium dahliae VdLs.17]|uniref:JmjC domain-containing protein n=1 Tax=Verticillium dahliae (strain VdLs.17 / ATCC MYA-4575 / FGSC 10137) TaxID=498257 RepID=G2WUV7_VERDV|nr:uncharacterized protein VDAG_02098 [Verticillium dahliae VdLs.17]EGY20082.1 hypothetical protein VDAG_02098 [Verticillium dahliae VdLs.17]
MASVSHTRACATTPPAPQPQTPPAKDQDDDDDDALVLTRDQLQRLHAFRDALHRCASASERDRLCLALRDQLIDHEGGHEILVACAERLTAKACAEYFQWRVDMAGRPPTPLAVTFREDHVAPWDRFFGLASIGYAARLRCLDALTEVAHRWGRHVVLHYDLVLGGPEYCHHVRIAARVIPTFDKAVVALNRCTKERAATQPPSHPARDISSHIDVEDLQRITQWWENGTYPRKHLRDEDLPPGYGFDDFHLMVPLEHAWPPIKSASSSPVSWPATSLITPVPSIRESVKTAAAAAAPQWSPYRLVPIPREHTTLAPPKTKASASQSTQSSENPAGETRGHHPPPAQPMAADPRCGRALHDRDADEAYRKQVLTELRQKVEDTIFPRSTHGEGTNRLIQELLEKAEPPNTSRDKGAIEMLFFSGDQAEALVDFESPHGAPIVTDGQQQFRWKTRERPIAQFLRRMGNLDRFISVQIPSRSALSESFEVRKLSEVKSRYLADESTDDPWNILDLQSPLPSAILPNFLSGENCQLLLQVRDTVLMEESAERVVASSRQWNEWRNVLEWVLMSQGGHNTAPHTDSHGFSTWITAQEGCIGFGWLSDPTDKERAAWIANPGSYTGGRWRYTVLKPGQTVFFVSGTIHFVFRIRAPQTLALGGHVLQWSGLERWMAIVLTQMRNPSITNEDMGVSAAKYVGVVSRLVVAKVNEDRANGLEIEDRILRFLDSVKAFETAYGQLNKKKRRSPAGSKKRAR